MLSKSTLDLSNQIFQKTQPYPYVCIDNFLIENFANLAFDNFPKPDDKNYDQFCIEDGGIKGSNYSNPQKETFPEDLQNICNYFESREFINWLQKITNIPELISDKAYQGGGLRASANSNFLPIHLDFNRHPRDPSLHRRINLLYYLNKEWGDEKGGHIQVHNDPNLTGKNSLIKEFSPIFNRCFIFETSEKSWHGFRKLNLKENERRKCISIYFYTKSRPEGDVPFRNTEYVEPAIPQYILSKLSKDDQEVINTLVARRDSRINMLYKLRREFDSKYSHLWSEYEWYLNKYREHNKLNN